MTRLKLKNHSLVDAETGEEIAAFSSGRHRDTYGSKWVAAEEMEAALRALLPVIKRRHLSYDLQTQVEEAFAKAEGRK